MRRSPDLINKAEKNNDPSFFTVFAVCLFWVSFSQCMGVPHPGIQVITEKAGNASLLGQIVGVVYAWIFPVPEIPWYFFSFKLRKKCCFHSTDSLRTSPCREGEVVACSSPKRGQQGCLHDISCSSSCAGRGGWCSFPDSTKRKIFLQLKPQWKDKTLWQGKQVIES